MNDNRTGIQAERTLTGIQSEKPAPPWESPAGRAKRNPGVPARHAGLKLALSCFLLILGIGASLPVWTDLDLDPPDPEADSFICPPTKQRTLWGVFSQMPLLIGEANAAGEWRALIHLYRPVLSQGMQLVGLASLISIGVYHLLRKYGRKDAPRSPSDRPDLAARGT